MEMSAKNARDSRVTLLEQLIREARNESDSMVTFLEQKLEALIATKERNQRIKNERKNFINIVFAAFDEELLRPKRVKGAIEIITDDGNYRVSVVNTAKPISEMCEEKKLPVKNPMDDFYAIDTDDCEEDNCCDEDEDEDEDEDYDEF